MDANMAEELNNYTAVEMLSLSWKMMLKEWKDTAPTTSNFVVDFLLELNVRNQLVMSDLYVICLVALLFTIHRYLLIALLLQPITKLLNFGKKDQDKFKESGCKMTYFTIFCMAEYYLVNYKYPHLQNDLPSQWRGWYQEMPVPDDIKILYIVEAGFYIHAIYATIYMDVWKKDSIAMLIHHVLAESLIIFSLAIRYHRIGLLVLYLHDSADVILEGTKLIVCVKHLKKWKIFEVLSSIGFILFSSNWLWCRLIRYPEVVLFSSHYVARTILKDEGTFYFFFNGMLLFLFCLNVWWFHFIILLIFRILRGQLKGVEDTREYDEKNENSLKSENHHTKNGLLMSNGHLCNENDVHNSIWKEKGNSRDKAVKHPTDMRLRKGK